MKSEFEELCEKFGVMKSTQRVMYPRQIKLSEKFIKALKEEWFRGKLEEDISGPVNNKPAKFLKALQFHLNDFEKNSATELDAYKRMMEEETAGEQTGTNFNCPCKKKEGNHKECKNKEAIRRKDIEKENI